MFFRLQPNVDTRQKQLAAWCSLVLSYCRQRKLYTLDVLEAQESPVFNNKKIESILSLTCLCVIFKWLWISAVLFVPLLAMHISHNLCCSGKLSVEAIQVVFEELRKKGGIKQAFTRRCSFPVCKMSFKMILFFDLAQETWNGWIKINHDVL